MTRPACCHEMQTFYDARSAHAKAVKERDELAARLVSILDAPTDALDFAARRWARSTLARIYPSVPALPEEET